eukprot:3629704-Amphidinium_carterae.1
MLEVSSCQHVALCSDCRTCRAEKFKWSSDIKQHMKAATVNWSSYIEKCGASHPRARLFLNHSSCKVGHRRRAPEMFHGGLDGLPAQRSSSL